MTRKANELRQELDKVFDDLRTGKIKTSEASELANIAGKMINSAKVQVEYYALCKTVPHIDFLSE